MGRKNKRGRRHKKKRPTSTPPKRAQAPSAAETNPGKENHIPDESQCAPRAQPIEAAAKATDICTEPRSPPKPAQNSPRDNDSRATQQDRQVDPQREAARATKSLAKSTFILAVATCVLAIVGFGQLILLGISVSDTGESAEAAKSAAATAEKALQISERAYVGAIPEFANIAAGAKFETRIEMRNVGRTPAIDTQIAPMTNILKHPLPVDFVLSPGWQYLINPPPKTTIVPGQSQTDARSSNEPLTLEQFTKITDEDSGYRLYGYGEVTYKDIFGGSHITEFCSLYSPSLKQAVACDRGNYSN